jgi:hypothetical protein
MPEFVYGSHGGVVLSGHGGVYVVSSSHSFRFLAFRAGSPLVFRSAAKNGEGFPLSARDGAGRDVDQAPAPLRQNLSSMNVPSCD